MLDLYVTKGTVDALRRFGLHKEASRFNPAETHVADLDLTGAGAGHMPAGAPSSAAGGWVDKAKAFGAGQIGHAKDLFGHLRQGLGGAATPEAGALARQNALGSLKGLAPTLAAGGALYMMHRHNQAKQEEEARRRAMMMQQMGGGGYPMM